PLSKVLSILNKPQREYSHMSNLNPGGNPQKAHIFCPHAIDGAPQPYKEFARAVKNIDADRPIYAISSPALDQQNITLPQTVEDMATSYIRAIKSKQPIGPYILFGWSFGGLLVYEMARQLMESNEEVIIVGLFDTLAPVLMQKMTNAEYAEYLLN